MEISFYELNATSLERTLPKLVQKAYEQGKRGIIVFDDEELLKNLNASLWTFGKTAFIPHGSVFDGIEPEEQPFWLSLDLENKNGAHYIFATQGQMVDEKLGFERCFDIFYGVNPEDVKEAQKRKDDYLSKELQVNWWCETLDQKWEKKTV